MKKVVSLCLVVGLMLSACSTRASNPQQKAERCFSQLEKVNSFLQRRPDQANMTFFLLAEVNPARPVIGNCHLVPGYAQAWQQLSFKASSIAQAHGQPLNRHSLGLR